MELGIFTEREELINAIKNHYLAQNVPVVLHRNSDNRRVLFKCYHGGKYRNLLNLTDSQGKRNTGSRLMECPFLVKALFSKKKNHWEIKSAKESHNRPVTDNIGVIQRFVI